MSLEELNQSLYSQKSEVKPRAAEADQFNPANTLAADKSPFQNEERWDGGKSLTKRQKRNLLIAVSSVLLIVLMIVGSIFYRIWQRDAFHEDRVSVTIEGPKEVDSTQAVRYLIKYRNDNRVALKNAEIQLTYLENFQPTDNVNLKVLNTVSSKFTVGDIQPKSEQVVELNGIFYAPKDFPVYMRAALTYSPSNNVAQELKTTNQFGVTVATSPVILDVLTPAEASDGDAVEYIVDYKNLDTRELKDVKIKIDYPEGFTFESAQPMASEKNSIWYVGNISAGDGGKIKIQGIQRGLKDEKKLLKIYLGKDGKEGKFVTFSEREKEISIVEPILSIAQRVDGNQSGNVKAGDNLNYVITYKNNGNLGLRDAIITAEVRSPVIDFSKMKLDKGAYDAKTGIITWKASDVPSLARIEPSGTGEVRFSIPIKQKIPVEKAEDKNYVVTSIAKIDSPDIPTPIGSNKVIGSNRLVLKVTSKVILETLGFYNDQKIRNSGPIPMKVGKETTFVLHWKLTNVSNELNDVKVTSSLPTGIQWTRRAYPAEEKFTYNDRTNQIVWDVGDVRPGAGIIGAAREVAFQVSITPQALQVGQMPTLLNKTVLTAKDKFTGEEITLELPLKNTQLPEDSVVGFANAKVEQ